MVNEVTLPLKDEGCMVVVAAYAKPVGGVLEDLTLVGVWPHRVIAFHVADGAVARTSVAMRADKVRTIIVIVFSVVFENTRILKHAGGID